MTTIDTGALLRQIDSHLRGSGRFPQTSTYEPKAPPDTHDGPAAACYVMSIVPGIVSMGSLVSTSVVMTVAVRFYVNMLQEPQEAIDPQLVDSVAWFMQSITGDFTLGDLVDNVDLLGAEGEGMGADFGYAPIGGTAGTGGGTVMYRTATVLLPCCIHDTWSQAR